MERALLMIIGIVFAVALVGFVTVMPQPAADGLTGRVVEPIAQSPVDECSHCAGDPVCGGKDGKASNYDNACAARCEGARVLYADLCERIPRRTTAQ